MAGQVILTDVLARTGAAEDELETLVREHSRLVYRIAYAALRHHHDAEDVVQEVFLRVVRHRNQLPGIADRRAWLARIAWNAASDRRKATPKDSELELISEPRDHAAGAERSLEQQQLATLVEEMIDALPRDLRDPLVLSAIEEMSGVEVATALGIPEPKVRARVFRARQILRERLRARLEVQNGR